jgi:hypothetical protein
MASPDRAPPHMLKFKRWAMRERLAPISTPSTLQLRGVP